MTTRTSSSSPPSPSPSPSPFPTPSTSCDGQAPTTTTTSSGSHSANAAPPKPRSRTASHLENPEQLHILKAPRTSSLDPNFSHLHHIPTPSSSFCFPSSDISSRSSLQQQQQQQQQLLLQQQLMLHYGISKSYPFPSSPQLELDNSISIARYGSFNPSLFPSSSSSSSAHYSSLLGYGAGLSRGAFTAEQWSEFTQQTYIFKHFAAGVAPPPALLLPIVNSLASMARMGASTPFLLGAANAGGFSMGMRGGMDPEPGRCRRTDGKKWRCSREVMPDQKYCERHMHRGRHRSRAKLQSSAAAPPPDGGAAAASTNTAAPSSTAATSSSSAAQCSSAALLLPPDAFPEPSVAPPPPPSAAHLAHAPLHFSLQPSLSRSDAALFTDPSGLRRLVGDAHQMGAAAAAQPPPNLADLLKSHHTNGGGGGTAKLFAESPMSCDKHHHEMELQSIMQQPATERSHGLPVSCFNGRGGLSPTVIANLMARQMEQGSWSQATARECSTLPWLAQLGEEGKRQNGADLSMRLQSPLSLAMGKEEEEEETVAVARIRRDKAAAAGGYWWQNGGVANLGGPLAEVLQTSSNNNGNGDQSATAGYLNLCEENWDHHNNDNSINVNHNGSSAKDSGSPSLASPTGVLQISSKSTFGAYSDSSSSASSPRSALKLDSVTQNCEHLS